MVNLSGVHLNLKFILSSQTWSTAPHHAQFAVGLGHTPQKPRDMTKMEIISKPFDVIFLPVSIICKLLPSMDLSLHCYLITPGKILRFAMKNMKHDILEEVERSTISVIFIIVIILHVTGQRLVKLMLKQQPIRFL